MNDRIVAFIDILGFKQQTEDLQEKSLLDILIHQFKRAREPVIYLNGTFTLQNISENNCRILMQEH